VITTLETKLKTPSNKPGIKVRLEWTPERDSIPIWNEICAWSIEQFGLPGDKFEWHPTEECMEFYFYDERDAIQLMLRWS
jgi:hypothetical protein